MQLQIRKLHPDVQLPRFEHATDAGLDLCSVQACIIEPGERLTIPTGLAVQLPLGYVGLIWDKSGLSHKAGLKTLGGVIDAGYRGEVMVGMVNLGQEPHHFSAGDKVAQLLVQPVVQPSVIVVDQLNDTTRGDAGFGSTGV
jgi:dUTP pyrophosphatase